MWRRAGEELITHRQAGEQQTDATRARLSRAQPGRREESAGGRRRSRRGDSRGAKCNEKCEKVSAVGVTNRKRRGKKTGLEQTKRGREKNVIFSSVSSSLFETNYFLSHGS